MAEPVLATSELKKKYGEVVAVDGVSWSVPQGSVFGLLGPNGAGKTTMIGMLLGLIKPDSGTISLFGDSGPPERSLPKIGAIMETPAFYPYLSGRDNLRYFQGISTHEDPAEIDRLLELVSLSRRADSKFSTYSLGMKHRLGIAYSLLGDPPLLLLDEPTNGLDPSGMAEVRSVIKELGSGDRTIVLASHLLNEVEQVCDSVAILSNGSLVAQGPVSELIDRSDRLRVDTTDNQHAAPDSRRPRLGRFCPRPWRSTCREHISGSRRECHESAGRCRGVRFRDGCRRDLVGGVLPGCRRRSAQ